YVFGDSFSFIPTFDIPTQVGQEFREAIESSAEKVGKVTFNGFKDITVPGDEINDSSSRGPSTPNFDIKPDVLAPGTNIMSTIPAYGKYTRMLIIRKPTSGSREQVCPHLMSRVLSHCYCLPTRIG